MGGITAVAGTVDELCTTVNCMTSLVSASAGEAGNFLDMLQGPLDGLVGDALEAVAAHVYANALKPLAERWVADMPIGKLCDVTDLQACARPRRARVVEYTLPATRGTL